MSKPTSNQRDQHLSAAQVYSLNEKHGWFEFGDAQSDVSKAFAQDAIDMHERMRSAAPDLLAALILMVRTHDEPAETLLQEVKEARWLAQARAAIAKATGDGA